MKYLNYLIEDAIKKALAIKEPETGGKYPSEEVERYKKMIDAAMKQASKLEQSEANDAIIADLRDKKKKWSNVDSETKPVKIKQEEPPPEDQEQDGEPPPEDQEQDGEPPPEEEGDEDKKKKKGKVPPQFQKKESKGIKGILMNENNDIRKRAIRYIKEIL
jgi:hypothetical protein